MVQGGKDYRSGQGEDGAVTRAEAAEAALRKVASGPCLNGAVHLGWYKDCREARAKAMGGTIPPEQQRAEWCPRCVAADELEHLPE